jgi:hypothetical protein
MKRPDPNKRIAIEIRDSTGALIRMHGTTEGQKHAVIERFKRDHCGVIPHGWTVTERDGVCPEFNRDTPETKCKVCRRPYEHTHAWARPLKICKRCADAYMLVHAQGQRDYQQQKGNRPATK